MHFTPFLSAFPQLCQFDTNVSLERGCRQLLECAFPFLGRWCICGASGPTLGSLSCPFRHRWVRWGYGQRASAGSEQLCGLVWGCLCASIPTSWQCSQARRPSLGPRVFFQLALPGRPVLGIGGPGLSGWEARLYLEIGPVRSRLMPRSASCTHSPPRSQRSRLRANHQRPLTNALPWHAEPPWKAQRLRGNYHGRGRVLRLQSVARKLPGLSLGSKSPRGQLRPSLSYHKPHVLGRAWLRTMPTLVPAVSFASIRASPGSRALLRQAT